MKFRSSSDVGLNLAGPFVVPWQLPAEADDIERLHSRGQHLCKFIETKISIYIRKKFNSHRIGLEHQQWRT